MGKGFNNYMTKKFFHPGSKDNIKRVWMAQQKTNYEKQKQDDLLSQYQKEQEMYKNRALLGDEKAKLGLSFMYDAPPGLKKKEVEEKEEEVKFEWQRKYNAPRENYAKDDETIRDQPFGIEVRNVRCIKCRKWGHVNTDRICPLFNQDLTAEPPQPSTSASSLLEGLQNDGFTLKKSILGKMADNTDTEKLLENEDELDPEVQFLKSLNQKQRKKLLKKLNKLKSREKKKKKKHKKKSDSSAEEDEQESPDTFRESESRRAHDHKDHRKDDRHQKRQRRSSSPANSPSSGRGHRTKRGESPRSLSRDHGSNFKERQRSRRSDSFERSKYRDSRGGNIDRNRSRSPIDRDRRSLNVDKEKQRRMRRSRSSSSDSDAAMQRRPQRQRSRSAERGQRSNRRSDSLERHTHTSRKRRSNSRDRRSRSRDRRSRSRDGRRRRSDS